jgi:hypothetical protein
MKNNHYKLQCPADTFGAEIMSAVNLPPESQRSKSQEHTNRLSYFEKTQKSLKSQGNQS